MTNQIQDQISAARRTYFPFFLMKVFETLHPGAPPLKLEWYILAMCHELNESFAGRQRRLAITVPPRHLKSITVAVAFIAWLLAKDPSLEILVASYGLDLARHHSGLTLQIIESDWYKSDYPGTKIKSSRMLDIETEAGGKRKAVSIDGATTGFGADYIIIDDSMKADDANSTVKCDNLHYWYENTMVSRLNDKSSSRVISIQQRLSERDLVSYLLEKDFKELKLPAIAEKDEIIAIGNDRLHTRKIGDLLSPERENQETLDQLRRELGPVVFSAQYQQDPVAPGGNLIQMQWFGSYEEAPERDKFLKIIQSWDTGMSAQPKSDYSVCTTWGFYRYTNKWYLLDVFRQRLDYPDLKRAAIRLHAHWKADAVIIEDASSGKSLAQDLHVSGEFRPIMMRPATSKEERFTGCLGEVEAGHFLLPTQAPWLNDFRSEIRAFPYGRNDDQVDSFSQFVNYQRIKWKYILTEYLPNGRAKASIRLRARPW